MALVGVLTAAVSQIDVMIAEDLLALASPGRTVSLDEKMASGTYWSVNEYAVSKPKTCRVELLRLA